MVALALRMDGEVSCLSDREREDRAEGVRRRQRSEAGKGGSRKPR